MCEAVTNDYVGLVYMLCGVYQNNSASFGNVLHRCHCEWFGSVHWGVDCSLCLNAILEFINKVVNKVGEAEDRVRYSKLTHASFYLGEVLSIYTVISIDMYIV